MEKMLKIICTALLIVLLIISIIAFFREEIIYIVYERKYDNKYKEINIVEKNISVDSTTNMVENNSININNFDIVFSEYNYNKAEKKLEFNIKFSNGENLNHVGYILRVYNQDYFLGDQFNGQISLDSVFEWFISQDKFYEKEFNKKYTSTSMSNPTCLVNEELIYVTKKCMIESLEDGSMLHKISFELPEEFIIEDCLKIDLFDLNYQIVGNKEFYQIKEPLTEIKYTINMK